MDKINCVHTCGSTVDVRAILWSAEYNVDMSVVM